MLQRYAVVILLWLPCLFLGQQNTSIKLTKIEDAVSNLWISSIVQDANGFIWLATQDGLYRYDGSSFNSYRYNPLEENTLPANWIRCIVPAQNGNYWVGTQGAGLVYFQASDNSFFPVSKSQTDNEDAIGSIIYQLLQTTNGALWVDSDTGLFRKKPNSDVFSKISDHSLNILLKETPQEKELVKIKNTLYTFEQDSLIPILKNTPIERMSVTPSGELIYRANKKIYSYDFNGPPTPIEVPEPIYFISNIQNKSCYFISANNFYKYHLSTKKVERLNNNNPGFSIQEINTLYLDKQEILWIGTRKGLYKENKAGTVFTGNIPLHARRIVVKGDTVFVGGMTGLHTYLKSKGTYTSALSGRSIFSLHKDSEGIWAGDLKGDLHFMDWQGNVKTVPIVKNNSKHLKVYGITEDKNGYLWVGSWEGLHIVDKKGTVLQTYSFKTSTEDDELKTLQVLRDTNDNLWIITVGNGIYKVPEVSKITSEEAPFRYTRYLHSKGDETTINTNVLYEIHEDPEGNLFFGSDYGINKYNPKNDTFEVLKIDGELFDKKTMAMETDGNGLLWISTIRNGLYVYDPFEEKLLNLNETDGLISDACLFTSSTFAENTLYFGTDEGVQIINPAHYVHPEVSDAPIITDIKIYGNKNKETQQTPTNTEVMELNYDQRDFSLHFSLHDYRFPSKVNYYYKLGEENKNWLKAAGNTVTFSDLKPEDYTFFVKAAYQKETDTPVSKITIAIAPPWHKTWWAYILYMTIFVALMYLYFYLKFKQKAVHNKLKAVEELDTAKSIFFANVSHELRTPLTLIKGPVEDQLASGKLTKNERKNLLKAQNSTQRMEALVEQLLALSKLESGVLKLKVQPGNLAKYVAVQAEAFTLSTHEKNIQYTINTPSTEGLDWFDRDIIETVLFNLVGNAVKYTPEKKRITITSNRENGYFSLKVENTGSYLNPEEQQKVFERFYQINDQISGTGIGLSLTKELVELHKGSIAVSSSKKGITVFTVKIPIEKQDYTASEILTENENSQEKPQFSAPFEIDKTEKLISEEAPILLIVDDAAEIRNYIASIFEDRYNIHTATNGTEALLLAKKHLPDVMVSDVMMPDKDGFTLTKELKENPLTSHIPIILLTGKSKITDKLAGLGIGADAYITKPFSPELVKATAQNLIENRRKLQKRFSEENMLRPKDIAVSSADEQFLDNLQEVLDTHLTDPDFTTEAFSNAMRLSRMQLHRKLKALSGQSTTEFLRSQRLKVAANLLKKEDVTVSEIGYQVGFSNISYFSSCFKKEFGVPPSEYSQTT
ncbi:hybrid sensor histidine kinase/response regulator transcription factor [Marixanthomonas spongiae]|uniref:histidine kinase n=1 Tax=Marixanthomonas spongiae TaxID=2174845 RepID=A0A2U0HTT6_9FLAO|nr:hybrid sensor histidine kinase/response regulator transcription factor [Marixanthomonas spongiae]PVW12160.1 hypothetical protein DDV96_15270 [Marixanthomonas spongiae]